jgi:Helix-turn-helix family
MPISARYPELVSLLPRFLHLQPFGWEGPRDLLQSERFELPGQFPAVMLLRELVRETDPGEPLSRQEMERRLFNPYATIHTFDHLPLLLAGGYLSPTEGRYLVTSRGRALIERFQQARNEYVATLTPLPLAELTRLADLLEAIAQRLWQASEPTVKAHQARCYRLPITTRAPMVCLDAAVIALWMARDDAHIAAWQAEGLRGPHLDILTRLWRGEAHTLPELTTVLQFSQYPQDILQGVAALSESGYVLMEGEHLTLTELGQQVRTRIEEETDRIYFTPWPSRTPEDLHWLCSSLSLVCDRLAP